MGYTHALDGLTSSTFRSKSCHDGVDVDGGVGDICRRLEPEGKATEMSGPYEVRRSHRGGCSAYETRR